MHVGLHTLQLHRQIRYMWFIKSRLSSERTSKLSSVSRDGLPQILNSLCK